MDRYGKNRALYHFFSSKKIIFSYQNAIIASLFQQEGKFHRKNYLSIPMNELNIMH